MCFFQWRNQTISQVLFKKKLKNNCIGLTGGIATGKSTIASYLISSGFLVIDADQLSREAVKPGSECLKKQVEVFSEKILLPSGELNRKELSAIIRSDPSAKTMLESIVHPAIEKLHEEKVRGLQDGHIWFYEAALILDKGKQSSFKEVWTTSCSKQTQLKRLTERDGISIEQAEAWLAMQIDDQTRRDMADFTINTELPLADIEKTLYQKLSLLRI